MSSSFKDTEKAFQSLRRQFWEKEISRREFIDRLKKLRLRDSQGRFWMIGAKSGKWYFFDGRDWVLSDPPLEDSGRMKCLGCGLENEAGAITCAGCGESLVEEEAAVGRESQEPPPDEEDVPKVAKENFVIRRLSPGSLFFFSGGTGLILGLILGAFAGASGFFAETAKTLPDAMAALHGTLMGGIIYAVVGGLLGFILLGAIGWLEAHLFNAIAAVAGGFRVRLEQAREKHKEEPAP